MSGPQSSGAEGVSNGEFARLESKVDKLTDAVMRLVVMEERQTAHTDRIRLLEAAKEEQAKEMRALERRVDRIFFMAAGASAAVVAVFEVVKFVAGSGHA